MNAMPKVLVVDDDAVVGRSFDRVLSEKGYAVSTALSGEEALENFESERYDLVFADIKMPGMDGLTVAERIKARCPWTPVVIVTGHGNPDDEARAKVLGLEGFVHKPLSPEMIEGITLKALLEKEEGGTESAAEDGEAGPEVEPPRAEAAPGSGAVRFLKNVGLFIAAPFVGLVYAVCLPFVGLGMLAVMGFRALAHRSH